MNNPQREHKKSSGWGVILSFLGMTTIALSFMGLIGYYVWQVNYAGGAERLAERFNNQFQENANIETAFDNADSINTAELIRPHNPSLGIEDAPVTIIAFKDFECPFCQRTHPVFKQIIDQYTPGIRIVLKHLPVTAIHPNALDAALAATCAQEQNKFWEYYDQLFTTQTLETNAYIAYAQNIGLNSAQFQSCYNNQTYRKNITEDLQDAANIGIQGTPAYVVNGKKIEGTLTKEIWDTIILRALEQTS